MAGGCEFRVSAVSFSAVADLTVLLDDAGPFEIAAVSTDWFVAAGPVDAVVPFVLVAAENRWSRSAGSPKLEVTLWNWSGSIIRKEPWVSNQTYQVSGVSSPSVVHFVFLRAFLESPFHSMGFYDTYQSFPTQFPGDPLF